MGRFVHLMATSLLVLVMISSNSPPSQAHPCFEPTDRDYCTASSRFGTSRQQQSSLLFVYEAASAKQGSAYSSSSRAGCSSRARQKPTRETWLSDRTDAWSLAAGDAADSAGATAPAQPL
nr:unnamed protein product [Digitaria exilis]